ncbi:MAG: hypothetical protein N2Z22_08120 [Turneriella sp.]|nr:hypothetical protein [Leptospiraceae bacterium]MCX7633281.1 hypothetical protein [Turneriella sp.]
MQKASVPWQFVGLAKLAASLQFLLALLCVGVFSPRWSWESVAARSEPIPNSIFAAGTVRALVRYNDWNPMLESTYRYETEPLGNMRLEGTNETAEAKGDFRQQPWHVLLGSYYNITNALMVGAFYRYAQGERHRNDWIGSKKAPVNNWDWFWLNTNNRPEHTAIGDVTWRFKASFLPGENWIFELKNRLWYTAYNEARYDTADNWGRHAARVEETRYVLRPGLQYFWLDGDQPFMTFFLQYEAHFAVNFGRRSLVESWVYLGQLYHLTTEFAVGLNFSFTQWWWTESDSVRNIPDTEMCTVPGGSPIRCNTTQYVTSQRAFIIGAIALLRMDLSKPE